MTAGEKQPKKPEDLKLPVRFVENEGIFDADGFYVAFLLTEAANLWLVHCINSHDSMAKEIQQLRDKMDRMKELLTRVTKELKELIAGEFDDPSVGVVGWNAAHDLVKESESALSDSTTKTE